MKRYLIIIIEFIAAMFVGAIMLGLTIQPREFASAGNALLFFIGMMCLAHLSIWSEINSRKKKHV